MREPWLAALVTAILLAPRVASAQGFRTVEVAAAYAWMNDTTDDESLPAGWSVGVAAGLNTWLSVAAEGGGQYKTEPLVGGELRLRTYAVMGGLRASVRVGPFFEFGQLLAGVSHAIGTAYGSTDSVTHVAWQPGAGLDLPLGPHVRARAEIDRRYVGSVREIRVLGAIVYGWRRQ